MPPSRFGASPRWRRPHRRGRRLNERGTRPSRPPASRNDLDLCERRRRPIFSLDVRRNMGLNARYQFVLLYTVGWDRIAAAAADINQAIEDGALKVGERAGLPLHRFALEDTAAAHSAVENGVSGKVLIAVAGRSQSRVVGCLLGHASASGVVASAGQRITRPAAMDDDQERRARLLSYDGGSLLLLGKGAVLAHRLARPLAAESDEAQQQTHHAARGQRRCCVEAEAEAITQLEARSRRTRTSSSRSRCAVPLVLPLSAEAVVCHCPRTIVRETHRGQRANRRRSWRRVVTLAVYAPM